MYSKIIGYLLSFASMENYESAPKTHKTNFFLSTTFSFFQLTAAQASLNFSHAAVS